jgi:hypothetical protein
MVNVCLFKSTLIISKKKHYSTSSTPEIKEEALPTKIEVNVIKLYENAAP